MIGFEVFCMRLLEGLFFIGLAGCSAAVVFSWISIFTSGFSNRDDFESAEEHVMTHPVHSGPPNSRLQQRSLSPSIAPSARQSASG